MKKYMGSYTNEVAKTLGGSRRTICHVTDNGAIYVTNGFITYKMNPPEYAAIAQPVICCEVGNYTMQNGEKAVDNGFDPVKLFNETVEQVADTPTLERYPLALQAGKAPVASYHSPAAGMALLYNAKFIATLTPSATFQATDAISAAVACAGGGSLILVLPIKPESKAARTVKTHFAGCGNDATAEADKLRAELAQAQNKLSAVCGNLNRATNKIVEPEAQQAAPAAEQSEPKTAVELIVARFADLAGAATTIKGTQTAASMVWLTGSTERYVDATKAVGAKWSSKKLAYYARVT